jgi:hypothetical protein
MPYVATDYASHDGEYVGESHQCVAFVKAVAHAPQTSAWRRGALVLGNLTLAPGTAIAAGWDDQGRYRSLPSGNHAAIYVRQHGNFIEVYDQSVKEGPVKLRTKVHHDSAPYYVIER